MNLPCGTKGSNLLSELQMGHQNRQDMSRSNTPCTGKSFHRGLGRRDALGECGPENLCMGLLMQIRHPAGGSLGQPNMWLLGPSSPLVPWDQPHLKGWRKGGSRLQEGCELPSLLPALLPLLRIARQKTFPVPICSPKATPSTSVGCPQGSILPQRQKASGEGITVTARISFWTHSVTPMGCYKPASFILWKL